MRTKKRKKLLIVLICVIIFCFLAALCIRYIILHSKNYVISYVNRNYIELELYAKDIINTKKECSDVYNSWDVSYWPDGDMVQFDIGGWGLGSGTSYVGFYYSPNNIPLVFQGSQKNFGFIKQENGWYWTDGTDNWQYTEKIIENWYWFEMHF